MRTGSSGLGDGGYRHTALSARQYAEGLRQTTEALRAERLAAEEGGQWQGPSMSTWVERQEWAARQAQAERRDG